MPEDHKNRKTGAGGISGKEDKQMQTGNYAIYANGKTKLHLTTAYTIGLACLIADDLAHNYAADADSITVELDGEIVYSVFTRKTLDSLKCRKTQPL